MNTNQSLRQKLREKIAEKRSTRVKPNTKPIKMNKQKEDSVMTIVQNIMMDKRRGMTTTVLNRKYQEFWETYPDLYELCNSDNVSQSNLEDMLSKLTKTGSSGNTELNETVLQPEDSELFEI